MPRSDTPRRAQRRGRPEASRNDLRLRIAELTQAITDESSLVAAAEARSKADAEEPAHGVCGGARRSGGDEALRPPTPARRAGGQIAAAEAPRPSPWRSRSRRATQSRRFSSGWRKRARPRQSARDAERADGGAKRGIGVRRRAACPPPPFLGRRAASLETGRCAPRSRASPPCRRANFWKTHAARRRGSPASGASADGSNSARAEASCRGSRIRAETASGSQRRHAVALGWKLSASRLQVLRRSTAERVLRRGPRASGGGGRARRRGPGARAVAEAAARRARRGRHVAD